MGKNKKKDICFTIMPFGGWFDSYYEEIYCPAIKNSGLIPKRADDLYRPSNIVNDIWDYTRKSKVILADLTNKNPNVFYELGLAHAITKPAILLTQNMDDIPFDLRSLRIIEYNKNSPNWGELLRSKIENAITEVISDPEKAIPPNFLEVSETNRTAISKEDMDILKLQKEMDIIKRELRSVNKYRTNTSRISQNDAKRKLRYLIESEIPEDEIVEILLNDGVPRESWIRDKYRLYLDELKDSN